MTEIIWVVGVLGLLKVMTLDTSLDGHHTGMGSPWVSSDRVLSLCMVANPNGTERYYAYFRAYLDTLVI